MTKSAGWWRTCSRRWMPRRVSGWRPTRWGCPPGGGGGCGRRPFRHDRSPHCRDRRRATAEEGCLSIPDIYGDVTRPERVVIEALDESGSRYRKEATGLKARAIQHEIDHLDGILFLDHLSLIRRQMLLAHGAGSTRTTRASPKRCRRRLPGRSDADRLLRYAGFAVASLRALLAGGSSPASSLSRQAPGPLPLRARPLSGKALPSPKASPCCSRFAPSATSSPPAFAGWSRTWGSW